MSMSFWHHVTLLLLVPAAALPLTGAYERDARFWAAFSVAALASAGWTAALFATSWSTGFAAALWLTVASSLVLFVILSLLVAELWRLGILLAPYLLLLALVALAWSQDGAPPPLVSTASAQWLQAHVVLSLTTYVFLTLAAVASVGVMMHERVLKQHDRPGLLVRALPALADCERLEYRLLAVSQVVLAAGIVTGLGLRLAVSGVLVDLDHKTVLTLAAFAVIGGLLIARRFWGTRGRRGARVVMAGYLLMTLAYPGVKFVTDVVIG